MKEVIQVLAILFVFASCKESNKNRHKEQFDKLEKVFEAGNWRYINLGDTAYLFFSREGTTHYKIYRYYMVDGDSVNTAVFNIRPQNDSIVMKVDDDIRLLVNVDERGSSWEDGERLYKFRKLDSLHILLETNGVTVDTLRRTLPISTFLVRSKYDFKNGTNTAQVLADTVRSGK